METFVDNNKSHFSGVRWIVLHNLLCSNKTLFKTLSKKETESKENFTYISKRV